MNAETKPGLEQASSVALDQWRGLALVLVVVAHAFHNTHRMDGLGRVGVNLFFFISGILVFRSLSQSRQSTPQAVTYDFWRRRLRRLYPALLAYVLVIVTAQYWLQRIPYIPRYSDFHNCLANAPAALFYYMNYAAHPPLSLGHLWSLACEMQFYFVAPLIFLLGGSSSKLRNLVYGGFLAVFMGLGIAEPLLLAYPLGEAKYSFIFAVWPMMAGFFCEYQRHRLKALPIAWAKIGYWSTIAMCLLGLPLMFLGAKMRMVIIAIGAVLLLPCLLAYEQGWTTPSAVGRWLRWLGERTYSIYLWQQPLTICSFLPVNWWPLGGIVAVIWGALWFRWFEQPFLSSSRRKILRAA